MKRVDWLLQHLHYREFPSRAYDNIPTFKEGRYQVGGPYLGMDHMPFNLISRRTFLKLFSWTYYYLLVLLLFLQIHSVQNIRFFSFVKSYIDI